MTEAQAQQRTAEEIANAVKSLGRDLEAAMNENRNLTMELRLAKSEAAEMQNSRSTKDTEIEDLKKQVKSVEESKRVSVVLLNAPYEELTKVKAELHEVKRHQQDLQKRLNDEQASKRQVEQRLEEQDAKLQEAELKAQKFEKMLQKAKSTNLFDLLAEES